MPGGETLHMDLVDDGVVQGGVGGVVVTPVESWVVHDRSWYVGGAVVVVSRGVVAEVVAEAGLIPVDAAVDAFA